MTSPTTTDPAAVLHFWFDELSAAQHFAKDAALDAAIAQRFGPTLEAAARGELSGWRASTPGRLAEIVVLDQFSRNVWRDTPRAFAQDGMALVLAQELVARACSHSFCQANRALGAGRRQPGPGNAVAVWVPLCLGRTCPRNASGKKSVNRP
jgi:uncharacterized protein (DUF924 family)